MNVNFLTPFTVDVMLKSCYLSYKAVSETYDGYTASRISTVIEKGLQLIRLAYSSSYKEGETNFDPEIVLKEMAKRSEMEQTQLLHLMDRYIKQGLSDPNNGKYWKRIRCKKDTPTPIELLEFLYIKFEKRLDSVN